MAHKRVLVTGAAGFIGRHVCRHFAALGWSVVGLGHGRLSRADCRTWGMSAWRTCDLTREAPTRLPFAPELIIHCAGGASVGYSMTHPAEDFHRNVTTLLHVLDYVRRHAPGAAVIYPSSGAVYGDAGQVSLSEEHPLRPVSPYGAHKKMAEELCRSHAVVYAVPATIIRFFSVYGPGLKRQLWWDACRKIRTESLTFWGTGKETRDWLHVEDAAALFEAAARRASTVCPVVNGGTGIAVSVDEVVREFCRRFGVTARPRFTGTPHAGDPPHYCADVTRASSWGWKPAVDWREGVWGYARWFQEHGG